MEEANLHRTVQVLKKELGDANKRICSQLDEISQLVSRIRERRIRRCEDIMTTTVNADSFVTTSTTDRTMRRQNYYAVAIFPEEVWSLIFGALSDPKDLWNLCNTCQLFEDILHQWKIGWMFAQTLPHFYRHLPGNKILECRRMCKRWNATVLNFAENHPSLRPHTGNVNPHLLEFVNPVLEKGLYRRNVVQFISSELHVPIMGDTGFNPFIGRYVILCIGEENYRLPNLATVGDKRTNDQLWSRVVKFLEYFGKDIWYLTIYPPMQDAVESKEKLRKLIAEHIFENVPNLRKLCIRNSRSARMFEHMYPVSFPPAPKLESLEFDFDTDASLSGQLLMRYRNQLQKIVVTVEQLSTSRLLDWPNLTELFMSGIWHHCDLSLLNSVRMPKLTKLGLNVRRIGYQHFDLFLEVMRLVHNVSSTSNLNTLRLVLGAGLQMPLDLPLNYCSPLTLKTLELVIEPSYFFSSERSSYDFLVRYFPALEHLHLIIKNYRKQYAATGVGGEIALLPRQACSMLFWGKVQNEKFIEFYEYLQTDNYNMYESDVWELLPRLKVFSIQWDVFTREGYEQYLRKLNT